MIRNCAVHLVSLFRYVKWEGDGRLCEAWLAASRAMECLESKLVESKLAKVTVLHRSHSRDLRSRANQYSERKAYKLIPLR